MTNGARILTVATGIKPVEIAQARSLLAPTGWKPAPLSRYEPDQVSREKRRQRRSGLWELPGFEREDSAGVAEEAAGVDRRGADYQEASAEVAG